MSDETYANWYRLMAKKETDSVIPDSGILSPRAEQVPRAVQVHERHQGESPARQRKAMLAGEAAQEPRRLAQAIAEFRQLDYEGHDSSFYVGHAGLD